MSCHQLSPPHGKLEACKGRFVGNDKTTPFLRKVKSMWAHGFLRKAYCEFSWGGLRMLSFPAGKERSQGLVSNALDYQSPYASPFTYPPVTRTNKIWRGRGVYRKRDSRGWFFTSKNQRKLAASSIQIFRKTAANLEAAPEHAHGTSHCESYRQKYKRRSSSPLSETNCCFILLLGLDAVLDSLSNRSCWRP